MALKFYHPHNDYCSPKGKLIADQVFRDMENFHRGDPVAIERQYGVPARTARDWHYHWVRDPEWRPWSLKKRRIAHQVFTPGEEFEIAQRIRDEISIPGTLFTDADFRAVAMEEYLARRWQEGEDWRAYSSFQDSKGFIAGFKKRNCFCSRRAHCKRRPVVDPARCAAWQQEIETLLATVYRDKIFNADETCWRLYPQACTTWAVKGTDGVHIGIGGEAKESLTVMATIRADGQKIPLYILAKGKTDRVEKTQIGDVAPHQTDHSESGWTTADTFARYLHWLSAEVQRSPIHLLLDIYPVHIQQQAKELARDLGMTLHFIPAGMTDQFQPLDRRVFGCLKSSARGYFMRTPRLGRAARIQKRQAIEILVKCWNRLSESVIEEAWSVYATEEDVDGADD